MDISPFFLNCQHVKEIQEIFDDIDAGKDRNAIWHRVTLLSQKATGNVRNDVESMVRTALERRKTAEGNRLVTQGRER